MTSNLGVNKEIFYQYVCKLLFNYSYVLWVNVNLYRVYKNK